MRWQIILLVVCVFLISCTTSTENSTHLNAEDNLSEKSTNSESTPSESDCIAGWQCVDEIKLAYKDEDCNWSELQQCEHGCKDNNCSLPPPAKVCSSGFKCKSEKTVGYQLESCDWIKTKKCEFSCENAECLPKPENYTEPIEEVLEEPAPQEQAWTLELGDEISHKVGENEFNVSLALIESKGARLRVNGLLSEWLQDGDNYYVQGINISIKEVLFQSYGGGIQEVSYNISSS